MLGYHMAEISMLLICDAWRSTFVHASIYKEQSSGRALELTHTAKCVTATTSYECSLLAVLASG
jgi:hypothetical protein